jgi:NIMA-interacting peptidyl-prolyl cis-trans isomerase 1
VLPRSLALSLALACSSVVACGGQGGRPAASNTSTATPTPADRSAVVSWDVLAREPVANEAKVKHILISWKDLADQFRGSQDPRAMARAKPDAEDTVRELLGKLAGGADFDTLMREFSEDATSAASNKTMDVTPDAGLVIEFRQLSLRLAVGEFAVCQSDFGFHIIKRFA